LLSSSHGNILSVIAPGAKVGSQGAYEISKATFGLTPSEYKKHKGLQRENLRDHMTDLELIFTMLGEAATTEIARNKDAQGFVPNQEAAREGGSVAGGARRDLEAKSGRAVVTRQNYLMEKPSPKRLPKADS
jgi:hypothetical protein